MLYTGRAYIVLHLYYTYKGRQKADKMQNYRAEIRKKHKIYEIAEKCGFSSSSNFYKAFFRITGKKPTDYENSK